MRATYQLGTVRPVAAPHIILYTNRYTMHSRVHDVATLCVGAQRGARCPPARSSLTPRLSSCCARVRAVLHRVVHRLASELRAVAVGAKEARLPDATLQKAKIVGNGLRRLRGSPLATGGACPGVRKYAAVLACGVLANTAPHFMR